MHPSSGDSTEMNSVPVDIVGPFDARDLLPPEIWAQVLDNLEGNFCDLVNAAESCSLFDDLLWEKIDAYRMEEVVPLLLKWVGHNDLLTCRMISKRIQSRVDNVLDNVLGLCKFKNTDLIKMCHRPPRRIRPSLEWNRFRPIQSRMVCLDSIEKVDRFREEMKTSLECERGRPFVGKSLLLYQPREDVHVPVFFDMNLLNRSIQLMEDFNGRLTHLNLYLRDIDTNMIGTYNLLVRLFSALPLLQSFYGGQIIDRANLNDLWELDGHIALNPLPRLAFLKQIWFGDYDLPTSTYNEIATRYGEQLESFQFRQSNGVLQFLAPAAEQPFPGLVELDVSLNCSAAPLLLKMRAENVVSLTLHLANSPLPGLRTGDFIQIFQSFQNVSMLRLRMSLDPSEIWTSTTDEDLFKEERNQNPNVKKLELWSGCKCLHYPLQWFLNIFPDLEMLTVQIHGLFGSISQPDPDLDLLKSGRLYESGLWEAATSLQSIQTEHGSYPRTNSTFTRDGYNQFRLI